MSGAAAPPDINREDQSRVFTFDAADVVSMTKLEPKSKSSSGEEDVSNGPVLWNANRSSVDDQAGESSDRGQRSAAAGFGGQLHPFNQDLGAPAPLQSFGDARFPIDVQQWRETGFGAYRFNPDCLYPGNGFWRPAYGGYPVSGPSSGLSRESSRDDLTSMEGQMFEYEERFRVDRRKLELLMIGRYDPVKEPAIDFFQRVGEETSTTVIWPSRLKIGAKSKKDPHIRIGGTEECVKKAKAIIVEYLDTKTTRVTMKMDVSYTDHSHIIGKGGNTIRRVMTETGCHIHFPDSNRSNPNEKSNQVSIAGEIEGVEKARARVRELAPLVFSFDLPIVPSVDVISHDPGDPYLKAIQEQYNIQIMFRQKQKNFPTTVVVVKGCEWEAARVKEATLLLVEHLCGTFSCPHSPIVEEPNRVMAIAQTIPISMNMEISPIHHIVVLGKGNMTLRTIMQRTKTTILFPDAGDPNIPPIRKGSVTITGSIHNVYFARQQLLGSLPLVMMFEMPDNLELLDDAGIQKLQEDLDVCISIKPKQRQANKSVLIKAQERNASSIYKVRQILLGLQCDQLVASIPETYKMPSGSSPQLAGESSFLASTAFEAQKGRVNFNHMLYPPPTQPQEPSYSALPQSIGKYFEGPGQRHPYALGNRFRPPFLQSPQLDPHRFVEQVPNYGVGNVLPPNHPYLQDYALLVLKNITRLQQQEEQSQLHNLDQRKVEDPNNNIAVRNVKKGKDELISPRNSSPLHELGNLTNQLEDLEFSHSRDSAKPVDDGGGYLSSSGTKQRTSSSATSVLESPSEISCCDVFSHLSNNNNMNQSELDQLLKADSAPPKDLNDWKAPGWEKKTLERQIGDYDAKRLLASKALQTKPMADQPRTPTTTWSGLGFSNSMPESVIRDQLDSNSSSNTGSEVSPRAPPPEPPSVSHHYAQRPPGSLENMKPGVHVSQGPLGGGNWFGNSSALDSLLNQKALSVDPSKFDADLPSLLAKQGLAKYTDLFLRHEVDMQTFASLTEQDMKEIGIQTFGARKKLLLLASKVKQLLAEGNPQHLNRW